MTRAYLALGSNLGDRLAHLQGAVDGLARIQDIEVVAVSKVYETDRPVGGPVQDDFLNAVVAIETSLGPHALLAVCQGLEQAAQRVRKEHWGPRTLDADILLFGDETIATDDLVVPHPRMFERGFVLAPLADVAPDLAGEGPWPGVRLAAAALR